MVVSRGLSFALGLALATPVAAYAYDGASKPIHHHHRSAFHKTVALAAAPAMGAPVQVFWPSPYVLMHQQYLIEGLSRDPNACVVYGCIGNN